MCGIYTRGGCVCMFVCEGMVFVCMMGLCKCRYVLHLCTATRWSRGAVALTLYHNYRVFALFSG